MMDVPGAIPSLNLGFSSFMVLYLLPSLLSAVAEAQGLEGKLGRLRNSHMVLLPGTASAIPCSRGENRQLCPCCCQCWLCQHWSSLGAAGFLLSPSFQLLFPSLLLSLPFPARGCRLVRVLLKMTIMPTAPHLLPSAFAAHKSLGKRWKAF